MLFKSMLRHLLIFSLAVTLVWTTVGCGSSSRSDPTPYAAQPQPEQSAIASANRLSDGQYAVQQATYDDANGEYMVFLLNTPPGEPSVFRTLNLPMARLTEAEMTSGQTSYLNVEKGQPSLHLTEDFKIEYVHNVTTTQPNPQTGQPETVVVRQESSFWTPFAGALAGQALGSLLFRPQYYVPPLYQPGLPLTGFGGYGTNYGQAVQRYQQRYQAPPAEVRNRQTFRTTGQLRSPAYGQPRTRVPQRVEPNRSTGSGYGSNTLRRSTPPSGTYRRPSSSFGSGQSRSFSRSSRRR